MVPRAHTSYLAWAWNRDLAARRARLITGFTGTPTGFGAGDETHLRSLAVVTAGRALI